MKLPNPSGVCRRPLTVNPADANGLEYGHEQQTHPAGGVRVKELEDVHPPLIGRDRCQFAARDAPPPNMSQWERGGLG